MTTSKQAQVIAPDAYPQMMSKADGARAMAALRSQPVAIKAATAMQAAAAPMRAAILDYVDALEECGGNQQCIFDTVHEIRGLAATAELVTTGRIADILCRYMDDMLRLSLPLDAHLVALHVAAIARAARAEDDDVGMGEMVAAELAALVTKRLFEAEANLQS